MAPHRPWWKKRRATAAIGYVLRRFHGLWNRKLVACAGVRAGDRVVDIGCGPGESAALIARSAPGVRVRAVDPAWPCCLATWMRTLFLPVRVHRAAAEALPVPDGWARLVVSIKAFHHWEDPRAGLAEVRRALAPGGRVMLADEDFAEGHQHTRFHREAATAAPTHAGSPEVEGWLRELGFDGIRLERVEDEEGVFHHVRYAVARGGNAGPPGAEGGTRTPTGESPYAPQAHVST